MAILTPPTPWAPGPVTVEMMNAKINALITELQAGLKPSAPVDITITATGHKAGTPPPQAYLVGGEVQLQGRIERTTATWSTTQPGTVASLPATHRPPAEVAFICSGSRPGGVATAMYVIIGADGTINLREMPGQGGSNYVVLDTIRFRVDNL